MILHYESIDYEIYKPPVLEILFSYNLVLSFYVLYGNQTNSAYLKKKIIIKDFIF